MKKVFTTALIALITITGFAQGKQNAESKKQHHGMENFTPAQRQELMLKKMTLGLDLNASQQKEMSKIMGEQMAKREAFMKDHKSKTEKPSSDQMFAMKSKMLDEQIAMKARVKKILSPEQFSKWEKINHHHHKGMKKHHSDKRRGDKNKEAETK
ncbi:hypothetical protein FFWV33_00340 [Flavobacterium faecale]|uniref:LTXXQ motif family protein n=1 Tax=Flavobacterium faecale TaxID=1355330 RepID=A0A2S1L8K9_9FLAO|nr:hypothetical protein [Flavobacterium faecale]AWG20075.1 hypothetical protein FFWV33_00340 [Flavobacterium faecale]